jgi:hypothetical protein
MALPYKETGPSFSAFSTHVEEVGRRLASTANVAVGEGKQDAPVGTTLALIEQATKVMDSAHKRLHAAQAIEFQLLKKRFQEDPEAFWRHNKNQTTQWDKATFLKALENHNLVPVSDPNNPTSLHRMAKAMAVKELQKASPELYDPVKVDLKVSRMADLGIEDVMRPIPANKPPDPRMEAIKQKAESVQKQNEIQLEEAKIKAATVTAQIQDHALDRQSREKIEAMNTEQDHLKIQMEQIIHANDAAHDLAAKQADHQLKMQGMQQKLQAERASAHNNIYSEAAKQHADIQMKNSQHQNELAQAAQKHSQDMHHQRQVNEHKVEAAKAMAKVAKTAKPATSTKAKKPKKGK